MKKYLLILLIITTPLIGQENTEYSPRREYKRPVFGLNLDLGYSYNKISGSGLRIGISPEFYFGKKVYFYMQFNLGYRYYNRSYMPPQSITQFFLLSIGTFDSFYFGGYVGLGGYFLEAHDNNRWSVLMNVGIGGALLFNDKPMFGEGAVIYTDLLIRYHINKEYAFQFGPALIVNFMFPSITVDIGLKSGLAF